MDDSSVARSLSPCSSLAPLSVRVSNELGSGRPRATRYAVVVVLVQSLAIGLLCMTIILATRNHFSVIFTSDRDMQRAVADIAYLLGITMVLNSIQPVISAFYLRQMDGLFETGVAVGGGWQALVAYINLGCYYIFGLPLGFLMGYALHWGTLVLLFIIWNTDWKAEAAEAAERVRLWGGQDEYQKSSGELGFRTNPLESKLIR
ncbi:hypothetical protein C4D60_Mb03t14280 [Musa balbisiana]|uniref:Protein DETOXIFICATION n=1 Tax=Musa balbisiana TaxID=52838 RepID=A0A4S8J9X7_MUSBA|nr:hypothetical protein C4D60_Mb03t14280 [Musa balbisiana]